jgi:lipopolysaccharide export system protein LptA
MLRVVALILLAAFVLAVAPATAQQTGIAFGGLRQDTSLPVEITADNLAVNNADGTAEFSGNVLVGQGDMRLTAATIRVEYDTDGRSIRRLVATGGVTLSAGGEAAEAAAAEYTIATGQVVMTGDVLLTQGASALAGQALTIDLKAGTGRMSGRVQTTFVPGGN